MTCLRKALVSVIVCLGVTICSSKTSDCRDIWSAKTCWDNINKCDRRNHKNSCMRTCGLCGDCKDSWGAKYCWENKDKCDQGSYLNNCKRICGACDECTDIRSDCVHLKGRCRESWLHVACRKTCLKCSVVMETERNGEDDTTPYTTPTNAARAPAVPVINAQAKQWPVRSGGTVTLTCSSRDLGFPPGALSWDILRPDARTKALKDGRIQLVIVNVSTEDDGLNATCRVTNDKSQSEASFVLQIYQKAVLGECKAWTRSATWLITGYCDVIQVFQSGAREYQCQWRRQNSRSWEIIRSALNLSSVSTGGKLQGGRCSFEDKISSDLLPYYLRNGQVTYRMSAQPGNTWSDAITVSIVYPETPTLACPVTALPAGSQLGCTCSTGNLGVPEGRLLLLSNSRVAEAGTYGQKVIKLSRDLRREDDRARVSCLVEWAQNISAGQTFAITVLYAPGKPELTVGTNTVNINSYTDFRCSADTGYGGTFQLLKVTSTDPRLIHKTNSSPLSFRLPDTKCEDAGFYYCTVSNFVGQANSTSVELNVLCSPQLLVTGKSADKVEVPEGLEGQLTFTVMAYPVPTIDKFTHHEEKTSSRQHPVRLSLLSGKCDRHAVDLHLTVCTLRITSPTVKDNGIYNAEIRNGQGVTIFPFQLIVTAGDDSHTSTLLPSIGALIAILLLASIVVLIVFFIKRQKGTLGENREENMALSDRSKTVTLWSAENITSEAGASDNNVYVNYEESTSLPVCEESGVHRNTEACAQGDLYAAVDKSRQSSSSGNTGKLPKPASVPKLQRYRSGSDSHKMQQNDGGDWSDASIVQSRDTSSNAAANTLQPKTNKEGLVYADLDFSQYRPDRQRPLPEKQETNYAAIDFSKTENLTQDFNASIAMRDYVK